MSLTLFKNNMGKVIYGISMEEAKQKGICIDCKKPALENCHSEAGKNEYKISGMCEKCFDALFGTESNSKRI